SEEHTSELQSRFDLVCRLLLEKKNRGRRAAIEFTDGTRIVLSADSKLRVPADYGVTARAVYLAGEAYFAIAPDASNPFAFHDGPGVIWDLGTRFGVRAYADEPEVEVVVAD